MSARSSTHWTWLVLTAIGSAVMVVLFVTGRIGEPGVLPEAMPRCVFKWATGVECPGCGGSHAAGYVASFQFREGWSSHPIGALLAAAVLPGFLGLLMVHLSGRDAGPWLDRSSRFGLPILGITLIAVWAARVLV